MCEGAISYKRERRIVTDVNHFLTLFLAVALLSAEAPGEQLSPAHAARKKGCEFLNLPGEWCLPIASVRKKGGGGEGVDGDVRFNSQQRGAGGGREIKISCNRRT